MVAADFRRRLQMQEIKNRVTGSSEEQELRTQTIEKR